LELLLEKASEVETKGKYARSDQKPKSMNRAYIKLLDEEEKENRWHFVSHIFP